MIKKFSLIAFRLGLFLLVPVFSIFISSCEKEVFTGPPDDPPAENAKIFIQSAPSKALIYYNNKYMGLKTPDTLVWLNSGAQTITLKMKLFKDTSFVVAAQDKKITDVFIDYYQNPAQYGNLYCRCFPDGADIIINNVNTGLKTPYTITHLFPGYYNVKYQKSGYRSDSLVVAAQASTTQVVSFALEDTTRWVSYNTTDSKIPTNYCYSIITDKNNIKWIGTDNGVVSFDGKTWKLFNSSNSVIQGGPVVKFLIDNHSNLWAATYVGLYMFNGLTWISWNDKLSTLLVSDLASDASGVIWISTADGIVQYDGTKWKTFKTGNSGLTYDVVNSIDVGSDGKLWYGTKYSIGTYNGVSWSNWSISNMKIDPSIGTIIKKIRVDKNGDVWVAHSIGLTERGGLTKYDGSKWTEVVLNNLSTDEILSIDVDKNNNKWLGTIHGLGKLLSLSDFKVFYNLGYRVPVKVVYGTTIDNNGDLWYVTNGDGIVKMKKGNY